MAEDDDSGPGTDVVLDVLLPLLVVILMLGMGATVQVDTLKKVLKRPKPYIIGFCSQYLVMPTTGLILSYILGLSTIVKISVMIVACCPGGTTSNLFSYWAGGDVALSIAMTTFATLAALGMLPLLLFIALLIIDPDNTVKVAYPNLILSLLATVIPALIGMAINYKWPQKGLWLSRIGSIVGFLVVLLTLLYGAITQSELFRSSWEVYIASILLGLTGFFFGFLVSKASKLSKRQQRTVALETGIQNGPLAIAIAELSFGTSNSSIILFPITYSFWIVIESIIVSLVFRQFPPEDPPRKELLDNQTYNVEVENGKGEKEVIYRSLIAKEKLAGAPEEAPTLYENYRRAAKKFADNQCLGWREGDGEYQWITFDEVNRTAFQLSSGFIEIGIKPKSYFGLYSINRKEWVIGDIACINQSIVTVPLYDTLGSDAAEYIANKVRLSGIICSNDKISNCLKIAERCPSLQYIIHYEELTDKPESVPDRIKIISYKELITIGKDHPHDDTPPNPDDTATICFTSGTTGVPKGAMISHSNLMSSMNGCYLVAAGFVTENRNVIEPPGPGDYHISYLPLAHIFERLLSVMCFYSGIAIGFYRGDVLKLVDDIAVLRPTIFASVPRLLNRIHDRILATVDSQTQWVDCNSWPPFPRFRRWMFYKGYQTKKELLAQNIFEDGFWDSAVFSNVAARLGGRVRLIITGSAPLSSHVMEFLRICFSCHVIEGYGQTETTAGTHLVLPGDLSLGHVGAPSPCTEVKLVDVPDLKFFTKVSDSNPNPCGEVCFRGNNIFQGYFEEPEKTKEAVDEDGWLHSGDIGRINPNGTLSIIDRKKNVFKLAQGEYVAPEKIENIYLQSRFIAQIWVHGDSLNSEVVAVVVPDFDEVKRELQTNGGAAGVSLVTDEESNSNQMDTISTSNEVRDMILSDISRLSKESKLLGFEVVKDIYVEKDAFTLENDLLTPTFKLKRHELLKRYRSQVDEMYSNRKKATTSS